MEGTYQVFYHGNPVGCCEVTRRGLYEVFSCSCQVSGKKLLRLQLHTEAGELELGVLVPENGKLRLSRTVAARRIPAGTPEFTLYSREEKSTGEMWIALQPDQPFPALSRLLQARLDVRNGIQGLLFPVEK